MQTHDVTHLLSVSRGEVPADLLLRHARIVNVFFGSIEASDIAISAGLIAGIGSNYQARDTIDLNGSYVAPGLIDAHVHIESSLCLPGEFARAVIPRGVTSAVIDPHEIANVAAAAGVRFMIDAAKGSPLRVVVMAPSCVPATHLATAGATLDPAELSELLDAGLVHGLAEMMNFPGVINADPTVLEKLDAFRNLPRDGHAPLVRAKALNAYIAAGIGSDHECVSVDEAREKLSRGWYILIREASNARNLDALLPLITPENSRRICFCTDDRQPADLLDQGSIDFMIRRAIEFGIDPITAFRIATLNPSEWFGLHDRGAIAPGRIADLFIFDDITRPAAGMVLVGGEVVARDGRMLPTSTPPTRTIPPAIIARSHLPPNPDLRIPARSKRIRVIGSLRDQLMTDARVEDAKSVDGFAVADVSRDLLKMAVLERHGKSGSAGLGFIHGFGLTHGAIAGTVAHDHHNLVVIGADDRSMLAAIERIRLSGGGLCATSGDTVLAELSLPVAGLMSDQPIEIVRSSYDSLLHAATQTLGSKLHDPFMAMSFMALEVIPKLKLTDRGLVDVEKFELVDLFL